MQDNIKLCILINCTCEDVCQIFKCVIQIQAVLQQVNWEGCGRKWLCGFFFDEVFQQFPGLKETLIRTIGIQIQK
jgi:hypothetical protein